jgi:hypothetical protein
MQLSKDYFTTTCAEADQAVVPSESSLSRKRNLAQFLESDEEQNQDTTSQDRQQEPLDEEGVPPKRSKGKGKDKSHKHRNRPLLIQDVARDDNVHIQK